ncbi:MAG: sensor histidine kinase [Pseudomonadota bacterium]
MDWFGRALSSLPAQLIGLFTLALLPLGLISIWQTAQVVKEANALASASLLARTVAAASEERAQLQNALGAAQGLAASIPGIEDQACSQVMREFVRSNPQYSFAGFVQTDGVMTCSTSDRARDFSGFPNFDAAVASLEPTVEVNPKGSVSNLPVFIVSSPVRSDGDPLGFVSISIPLLSMADLSRSGIAEEDRMLLATINQRGEVIAASGSDDERPSFLPRGMDHTELLSRGGETFLARAGDDTYRHFAVAPLLGNEVALIGSWPADRIAGAIPGVRQLSTLIYPVLMWLVGISVAYFGLHRLVVRHIASLQAAMRRFALGERGEKALTLSGPPNELADVESAFNRMARTITEAENRREADLREKEVLLKEVHHRVKNNLQLITSIMNMKARSAKTPEVTSMLEGLQQRVRGLAMLHRTFYATPEVTTVDASELTRAVVEDVVKIQKDTAISVTTPDVELPLFPDMAVPLSMLLAEVLSNAIAHAGCLPKGRESVDVVLDAVAETKVRLSVTNTLAGRRLAPVGDDEENIGIGTQLMAAFVAQLDGEALVNETPDAYSYTVTFDFRGAGATAPA